MSWITTVNDKTLDYINPDPRQISINDIATGLSNTPRWAGQIVRFYSVAEHSLITEFLYQNDYADNFDPAIAKAILLHDATEAYMCDLPRPLKQLIPSYISIEKRLGIIIKLTFGIPDNEEINKIIRKYDDQCLKAEAIARGGSLNWVWEKYSNVEVPEFFMLKYLNPTIARESFLIRWRELNNV